MNKASFEEILASQGRLVYTAQGDSMFPQIQPRDLLVIEAPKAPLRVNDVPLYRRPGGQYVLHRIVELRADGYVTRGDNRRQSEPGVTRDQIIGVLTAVIREGKSRPVEPPEQYMARVEADLLLLLRCALDGSAPAAERVEQMDFAAILRLAQRHRVAAAAAFALERTRPLPHEFDQAKKKAQRKLALFELERPAVLRGLENSGIRYMPLKGILLKEFWPRAGMREMDDNDLLVEPGRMEEIRSMMEGLGFTCERFGRSNHDVYSKAPSLEFEIHWALFLPQDDPRLAAYYRDCLERSQGEGCLRRMGDEDLYLYHICHAFKHYSHAGTGLRTVMDNYLFWRARPALDRDYLDRELEKLGLGAFESRLRSLGLSLFSGEETAEPDRGLLDYLLASGSSGVRQNLEANRLALGLTDDSPGAKGRYLLRRIRLDREALELYYPQTAKHKALYPLFLLRRVGRMALHPARVLRELRQIKAFRRGDPPKI